MVSIMRWAKVEHNSLIYADAVKIRRGERLPLGWINQPLSSALILHQNFRADPGFN